MKLKELLEVATLDKVIVTHEKDYCIMVYSRLNDLYPLHSIDITITQAPHCKLLKIDLASVPSDIIFIYGEFDFKDDYKVCPECLNLTHEDDFVRSGFDYDVEICPTCKEDE